MKNTYLTYSLQYLVALSKSRMLPLLVLVAGIYSFLLDSYYVTGYVSFLGAVSLAAVVL